MYSEAKLALIIYLWYPKTKGTRYIYDTLLKPYVSRHEPDIDRSFLEFRTRAFDLAIYYWQNCTELGQAKLFQFLDFASPSRKSSQISSEVFFSYTFSSYIFFLEIAYRKIVYNRSFRWNFVLDSRKPTCWAFKSYWARSNFLLDSLQSGFSLGSLQFWLPSFLCFTSEISIHYFRK